MRSGENNEKSRPHPLYGDWIRGSEDLSGRIDGISRRSPATKEQRLEVTATRIGWEDEMEGK